MNTSYPNNSDRRLHVLHIAPTPFFADRGCHIRIRNEIESLPKGDVSVSLCTYHQGRNVEGINTYRIVKIPGYTSLGVGFSLYKFPADLFLFIMVLWKTMMLKPDILHCHLHEGVLIGWAARILLFWRRIALVMDMQGSLTGELASYGTFNRFPFVLKIFRLLEKIICRLPDRFFCSSERSRDILINEFQVDPGNIYLLQDVVADSCDRNPVQRKDLNIPCAKKVIVYSGSLLAGKGINSLKYLMKRLLAERDDLFFLIIGYPVDELAAFIQQEGLAPDCFLTGRLEYEKLLAHLTLADLAIEPKLAASGEASGKTLHYMAAGLPVVCFDTENNRQILGESGYYAQLGSDESLAEAVILAMEDYETAQKKAEAGREMVRKRYSMNHCRRFLLTQYAQLTH